MPHAGAAGDASCAVLLLPDVFGLSDFYRSLAERLAEEGFATLALEPWGAPVEVTDPGRFLRERSDPEVLARVQQGVDFLAAQARVRSVGVLGFCIGGTYALLAACELRGLAACVSCYGILSYAHGLLHEPGGRDLARKPVDPLGAVAALRCPALGLFGGRDEFVPEADVLELAARARAGGRALTVRLFPDAGHAFLNETRPHAYRPDDAREAWTLAVEFLRRELSAAAR